MNCLKKMVVFCLFCSVLLFSGCSFDKMPEASSEVFMMNTFVTQKVYGNNADKAMEKANQALTQLEDELSLYKENSDIFNINKNAGLSPVKVKPYTLELLRIAQEYSGKSQGLFDITVAPLSTLWGITSDDPKVPSEAEIQKAVSLIDYRNLELDFETQTAFLTQKGMALDLGGVAKGYIVNQIKAIYDENEISSALISIGGNIYTYHKKTDGTDYTLGIRNPSGMPNDYMGKLKCHDMIVATTGAYERFFEKDGVKYHHILDIKTGYPVESDLLSVTIVSENGGLADYLSTTLYIAGKENINQYLNHSDFSVIVIDKQNKVYISDKLKANFEITNSDYTFA